MIQTDIFVSARATQEYCILYRLVGCSQLSFKLCWTWWLDQLSYSTASHNIFLCDSRWEKHGEGQSIVFVGVPCRLLADGEQLGQGVQFVPWLRHLHVVDRCDPWRILLYPVAVEQLVAWDFWMRSNRSRKLVPLHHSIPTGTIFFGGASSCMFATIIYN